ncbi:MAG TPA: carboxypeptidase regulatory-like domain-containing protein, partial [Thermoanaerobaculia bacterium]
MRKLAALLCLLALPAFAQTTGSLTGNVAPNAKLTLSSPSLQGVRQTTANASGAYLFEALPPGEYVLRAEGAEHRVRVQLGLVTRLDVVDVIADAPTAVDAPEISTNLTRREIERLPIQRNQLATAQFAPGVVGNVFANGQLLISGAPGYDNLVLVNGVAVGENLRGQMRPLYVEDAIEETTILSGAISAEYGRFTGGVVSTVTRSGGNSLQGSLRDNLSNPQWAASSPANEERPDTLNQVWEATFGGFAIRDRLWFFTAGRWAKNTNARQTSSVPPFGSGSNATPASPAISYSEEND